MHRRSFLSLTASAAAATALGQSPTPQHHQASDEAHPVLAMHDRTGELHTMGYSHLAFKVLTADSQGSLFMAEHAMTQRGGPPLHVHPNQDETFYVLEGEYIMEVGGKRATLHAGDCVLAPRSVPHVWACTSGTGKMIISFTPAGKMEAFFNKVSSTGAPLQDAALFAEHDMILLGKPLAI